MGERMFWIDEREETSEEFESSDDDYNNSNSLSPHLLQSQQREGKASAETSSPLGLTLTKTPSFLSLLQHSLSEGKKPKPNTSAKSQPMSSEKLKASNFPAMSIQIGSWQRISRHQGEVVAKLYYAKRKLVWEILDRALKSKIEIQWSDIIAIRAITPPNAPGTLEIELNRPPLFYRESNPQPRKHTLWHQTGDFTCGQAPLWRRHYVKFPPGILDRHYEKLLQCDDRLSALSRNPFPSCESPYFDWKFPTELGLNFGSSSSSSSSVYFQQPPYPAYSEPSLQTTNWGNFNQGMQPSSQGFGLLSSMARQAPPIYNYSSSFQESTTVNPNYYQYSTSDHVRPSPTIPALDYSNWFGAQEPSGNIDVDNTEASYPGNYKLGYYNP